MATTKVILPDNDERTLIGKVFTKLVKVMTDIYIMKTRLRSISISSVSYFDHATTPRIKQYATIANNNSPILITSYLFQLSLQLATLLLLYPRNNIAW